jgi:hypothetical protein
MAQKTQGAFLSVSSTEAVAKTITAATAASPVQVTSAAHGYANGAIIRIASVVGMVELNNRAFVVANQAANTLELKGVDGLGYSTYSSAGSMFLQTMLEVGECRAVGPGFDGEAQEIDVTHLRSSAKEYLLGMQDPGNVAVKVWIPTGGNAAQARLRKLKETAAQAAFSLTLASGEVAAFMALVKSFTFDELTPDNALSGSINLRVSAAPAWFA